MKNYTITQKMSCLLGGLLLPALGFGQQWLGASSSTGLLYRNGNVQVYTGIGSASIGNAYGQNLNYGTGYLGFNMLRDGSIWSFSGDGANNGGSVIYGDVNGGIHFSGLPSNSFVAGGVGGTVVDSDVASQDAMVVGSNGKVRIGNVSTPSGYRLFVQEGILTEKLKIALSNNQIEWADFVFDDSYKLMPLSEVKQYIEAENHLPNMPSACELEEEGGIDVHKMLLMQQQKIEELYLYIIELEQKIVTQSAQK